MILGANQHTNDVEEGQLTDGAVRTAPPAPPLSVTQSSVHTGLSLTCNSEQFLSQVTTALNANGTLRIAVLLYSNPDVKDIHSRFDANKHPDGALKPNDQPYLAYYDLPELSSALATGGTRPAASQIVSPGYHRWLIVDGPVTFDCRNERCTQAVFSGFCHMMTRRAKDVYKLTGDEILQHVGQTFNCACEQIRGKPYFDVQWTSDALSIDHIDFTFTHPSQVNLTAKWVARGPCSPTSLCTIAFNCNISCLTLSEVIDALRYGLAPRGVLLDLWQLNTSTPPNSETSDTGATMWRHQVTGQYVALVAMQQEDSEAADLPSKARADLPGYLYIAGRKYFLSYLDRRPWCNACMVPTFHERADCLRLVCQHCNTKGLHYPQSCKDKEKKNKQPAQATANLTRTEARKLHKQNEAALKKKIALQADTADIAMMAAES